ncbi:MAG: helical backbone metal receptor [Acidobacteriota bacterium]
MPACVAPPPSPLVDQVGNPVPRRPVRRLLPLAPDVTELAFALGAGSRVIAAPPHGDYPPAAALLPRVDPGDTEAIVALRPDLVLATTAGNDPRVVTQLIRLQIPTATVDVTSCESLAAAAELVGQLLDERERGSALAGEMRSRCAVANGRAAVLPRRGALYVVWWAPLVVAAPGTFHADLLERAGLTNLAPSATGRYPQVDPEVLLDARLELVVAADEPDVRTTFANLLGQPAGVRARAGTLRVIWLPADQVSRPGPRFPAALEALVSAREARP